MILHIARVIFILLEVLILFNLLIVVHELGHFLAARCGASTSRNSASGSANRFGRRQLVASNTRWGHCHSEALLHCRNLRRWTLSKAEPIWTGQDCRKFPLSTKSL